MCGLLSFSAPLCAQQQAGPGARLEHISTQIREARSRALEGHRADAQAAILRVYLDEYEPLESLYGGSGARSAEVATAIGVGETAFHAAMSNASADNLAALDAQLRRIRAVMHASAPDARLENPAALPAHDIVDPARATTPEIRAVLAQLKTANTVYAGRDAARALSIVEQTYLERFETLEARLPRDIVERTEKNIHLRLRPAIKAHASAAAVSSIIGAIGVDLLSADRFLAQGGSVWFAVLNSFVIVVR
ncbi:MAG TPA: hypothetical protein VF021_06810, partial [Longimicrobiales bacterium]